MKGHWTIGKKLTFSFLTAASLALGLGESRREHDGAQG